MSEERKEESSADKAGVTMTGTVEKIIRPVNPKDPEKAQINLNNGEDLYREIRIDNVLENEKGETVRLKQGAEVEVTVEADASATTKKNDGPRATSAP